LFESEFLTSSLSKDVYRMLIARAAEIVCESFPNQPYSGRSPAVLAETVGNDFLPLRPNSPEQIAEMLRTVVSNSIAVSSPHTAAHLHCPPLLAALTAEVVISALNQSMDSFDQAPIATVVEQKMIRWLATEAGLPPTAAGTFTTGGSQSNYMGLLLARDAFLLKHWDWAVQKSGLPPEARRMRILSSEAAHFTVEKSASQLGLGTDAVVRIDVDDQFRLKPSSLRSNLEVLKTQGLLPMAIVATAGTTDFGSIDPLPEIAAVARETKAWLHVDAAYGGALLFSAQHRSRLAGIENADSITIDFHKLFWQPIPCSAFLVRDARHFDTMRLYADYLNPEIDVEEGIPNLVTTSLLTSRRFDALKLWISFQTLGREKLAAMIDHTMALANHAATVIRNSRDLELVCEPQLGTVVFRYVPSRPESNADRINREIPRKLFDRGVAVIGHTRVQGRHCLKLTCMNPATTEGEMEKLIELISSQGRECAGQKANL
jgi:L-2,4-diaminobutyrate decarboxylase